MELAKYVKIEDIILHISNYIIIDVRTPNEYNQAHIPLAYNIPLFTNEERAEIGTVYKNNSTKKATLIGLDYFGKRLTKYIEELASILKTHPQNKKEILIHCWRGGMRSAAIAWLFKFYGYEIIVLQGGYKAFRQWCLLQFELTYPFYIIGGFTGSGKTSIIQHLIEKSIPAIDLEGLAQHRGSTFGGLGMPQQPRTEMFENLLALSLFQNNNLRIQQGLKYIFLEDESQRIGQVLIPTTIFKNLRNSRLLFIHIPFEKRLQAIVYEYGKFSISELIMASSRLEKRLGGLLLQQIIAFLEKDDKINAFTLLLQYYDKYYASNKSHQDFPRKNKTDFYPQNLHINHITTEILKLVE